MSIATQSIAHQSDVIEGTITIDGVTVPYFDSGHNPSQRPPIVMCHGTTGSTTTHFSYLFPMLAARQRVISFDFTDPGTSELSLDQLVRQASAVIDDRLGDEQITLLGYSLGAVVAARLAAIQPQSITNLILVAGWQKTDQQQLLRNDVWQELRRLNSSAIGEYTVFCAFSGPFLAARTATDIAPAIAAVQPDHFADLQMSLNRSIDIESDCENIKARTLVIGCTYDYMVPVRHSKALFGSIPDARYTEIATGHAVVFERPAELFAQIEHFQANPNAYPAGSIIPASRP